MPFSVSIGRAKIRHLAPSIWEFNVRFDANNCTIGHPTALHQKKLEHLTMVSSVSADKIGRPC